MRYLFAILLIFFALPLRAQAVPYESKAPIAYLVDVSSGVVLLDKDSGKHIPTASMAKMMTAYVAFEAMESGKIKPDTQFAVKPDSWKAWNNRGSTMFLKANEKVSVANLLRGVLTLSGNDASVVLAEGISGNEAAFTGEMNKAAAKIGMADSHFGTANGWPDGGRTYSTARDLSLLALQIINEHPGQFREYFGQPTFRWSNVTQANRNPLLGAVEGADGMKTGHSEEAGYCLVGTAERGGRRLIMVIAGLPTMQSRIDEARAIMQWGFDNWQEKPLFEKGQKVALLPTQLGETLQLQASAPHKIAMLVAKGQNAKPKLSVRYNGPIKAPVRRGEKIAELIVRYPDGARKAFPLVAASDLGEAGFFIRAWNGVQSVWHR